MSLIEERNQVRMGILKAADISIFVNFITGINVYKQLDHAICDIKPLSLAFS